MRGVEYELEVEELRVKVCEGVYPPSEDTYLLLDGVKVIEGHTVIEVGSGLGLAALRLAQRGAFTVASDIDLKSARCTKLNAWKNGLRPLIDVVAGDLLTPFRNESFEGVAFNPPYLPVEGESPYWSGGTTGRKVIYRFIEDARAKLKKGGCLLLVHSTLSGVGEVMDKLRAEGFDPRVIRALRVGMFEEIVLIAAFKA
ncbi:MAG: methyltransferase [Thermoprotei archaeon]|nr:MAG: methyltransferase [Thermoprotei archaeon]